VANSTTTLPNVAVTTTLENELLLFVGANFGGGPFTPSGYTERADVSGNDSTTGTQQMAAAGSSGNKSATSGGAAGRVISWLAALKPYAGAASAFDVKKASQFIAFF
jgi:hypothetical protein